MIEHALVPDKGCGRLTLLRVDLLRGVSTVANKSWGSLLLEQDLLEQHEVDLCFSGNELIARGEC